MQAHQRNNKNKQQDKTKIMSTTSPEEALLKAKEIAARLINGGGDGIGASTITANEYVSNNTDISAVGLPATSTTTATATATAVKPERKRKRWGSVASSDSNANVTEALPGLAEAKTKQQQAVAAAETSGPTSKRIWVPTSRQKAETHFSSFLKERLPELSSRINNNECNGEEQNKLVLSGRGAASIEVFGMPLEPMHVMIHGSGDFIAKAATKLEELLAEAERADREGPPPEDLPDGQAIEDDKDKYSSALTLTRPYYQGSRAGGAGQSSYRPATVAQLISNNPDVLGDIGLGADGAELIEEIIKIPNGVVGFVVSEFQISVMLIFIFCLFLSCSRSCCLSKQTMLSVFVLPLPDLFSPCSHKYISIILILI